MALFGQVAPEVVAARLGSMLVRGASRVRAGTSAPTGAGGGGELESVETTVRTELFAVGAEAHDLWTDVPLGMVDGAHGLRLALAGHEARVLRIGPEAGDARSGGR